MIHVSQELVMRRSWNWGFSHFLSFVFDVKVCLLSGFLILNPQLQVIVVIQWWYDKAHKVTPTVQVQFLGSCPLLTAQKTPWISDWFVRVSDFCLMQQPIQVSNILSNHYNNNINNNVYLSFTHWFLEHSHDTLT